MTTLEWLGTTTFRLKTGQLTIFHDAFIDRPSCLKQNPPIQDFTEADYIFISHAHFDHVADAHKLAKQTGAIVVGSSESIRLMREAGVPEENLLAVNGGERVPLFTRQVRDAAASGQVMLQRGPPGAPLMPHPSLAAMTVHVWPSLHALLPFETLGDAPEVFDTGKVMTGEASHQCSLDVTRMMTYGLLPLSQPLPEQVTQCFDEDMKSFVDWMKDPTRKMSGCDGGTLIFNFLIGKGQNILFNGQLGAYQGILKNITDKPNLAVLAVPGRGNLNGRPFEGSAADFLVKELKCLGEPERVVWCLHDPLFVNPKQVDVKAARDLVERKTSSKVWDLEHGKINIVFQSIVGHE